MSHLFWWTTGCPWIPYVDHVENREALGPDRPERDPDRPPDGGCVDDLLPVEVDLPTEISGSVCPNAEDQFIVTLGGYDVLSVLLDVDCGAPLAVELRSEAGAVLATPAPCDPTVIAPGAGQWVVAVATGKGETGIDYGLSLDTMECRDDDSDGFLAMACGGSDCVDSAPEIHPEAADDPATAADEDCDGGNDLSATACSVVPFGEVEPTGTEDLPCADLDAGAAWDRWLVPDLTVFADVTVSVVNGAGAADLLAFVVAPNGTAHLGREADRSQLDDDIACPMVPWTGDPYACPAACLEFWAKGDATIWVAQHPGSGCIDHAAYTLVVSNEENALPAELLQDDVLLDWP